MAPTLESVVTLISLFLTPILLVAAIVVVGILKHSFSKAINTPEKTPMEWMIIGIVISFVGSIFDNIWWFLAWSYEYIDPSGAEKEFFFHYGVYSNTLFRQIFGIVGALCHIYAGSKQGTRWRKTILFTGSALGIIQVIALILSAK